MFSSTKLHAFADPVQRVPSRAARSCSEFRTNRSNRQTRFLMLAFLAFLQCEFADACTCETDKPVALSKDEKLYMPNHFLKLQQSYLGGWKEVLQFKSVRLCDWRTYTQTWCECNQTIFWENEDRSRRLYLPKNKWNEQWSEKLQITAPSKPRSMSRPRSRSTSNSRSSDMSVGNGTANSSGGSAGSSPPSHARDLRSPQSVPLSVAMPPHPEFTPESVQYDIRTKEELCILESDISELKMKITKRTEDFNKIVEEGFQDERRPSTDACNRNSAALHEYRNRLVRLLKTKRVLENKLKF